MKKRGLESTDTDEINEKEIKRKRSSESDEYVMDELVDICSTLCKDTWSKIVEFCDTPEWLKLSYTCKRINQFKFNRSLMFNKKRTLISSLDKTEIQRSFQLGRGTLFNVDLTENGYVVDGHFQYLEGIHTLNMNNCTQITDQIFPYLAGIHTLDMGNCTRVTDRAFYYLTDIHTLNMSGCTQITDQVFPYLAGIRALNMSGCTQITDNAFSHLTGIHTLNMSGCTQITGTAFSHLAGIHSLTLDKCNQSSITRAALFHLGGIRKIRWYDNGRSKTFIMRVMVYCQFHSIDYYGLTSSMRKKMNILV